LLTSADRRTCRLDLTDLPTYWPPPIDWKGRLSNAELDSAAGLLGRHNSKRELKRLKPELAKALAARRASEKHTAEAREDP